MSEGISRRDLARAACLVPLAAVRGTAANSAVTVGLIGSGGRGTFDAGLLVKNPNARLVALCDIFDDRIERAKKNIPIENPKVYKDYHELLASDVDAVIIATPVFLHPEHFEAAVKAGKNIYIEKPAGLDVEGCRRVMRAADSAGRKFNIVFGFQQRYGQGYLKARKLVADGAIGKIHMAHAHWIKGAYSETPLPPPRNYEEKMRQWTVWKDWFGDIIVETYCHGIDVLNWFLDAHPVKAYGAGGRTVEKRGDISDHCDVTLTYADNVQAVLTGSQIAPPIFRSVNEQFYGAKGVIETAREYWTHYRGRNDTVTEKSPREITIDSLETFIRNIQNGTPENTAVRTAESTLTAIMGRMAIDQKREITWAEVSPTAEDGFIPLFNGKTLDGWDGDPALWSVENGAIVGSTDHHPIQENSFLIYRQKFSDLILRFDIKLRNHNSGVQFRSAVLPHWVCTGLQADASEVGDHSAWGNLYEEKGRGRDLMKTQDEGWQKVKSLVRHQDWNTYEVFAQGNRIKLTFNGIPTIDLTDDKATDGVIALQLHAGIPMRVEFRNIRLKPLK